MTRLLTVSALALLVAVPALAAAVATPVGEWRTGPMRAPDGAFQYCLSEAKYQDGTVLIFALNPGGQMNVGFGRPGGTLSVGEEMAASLQVDAEVAQSFPAKVINPQLTVVSVGVEPELYKTFAKGKTVIAQVGERAFVLGLKGSGKALKNLEQCVAANAPAVAAPAAVTPATAPAAPPEAPPVVAPIAEVAPVAIPPETQVVEALPVVTEATPPAPAATAPETPAQDEMTKLVESAMAATPEASVATQPPTDVAVETVAETVTAPAPVSGPEVVSARAPAAPEPAPEPAAAATAPALPAQLTELLAKAGVKDAEVADATVLSLPAETVWQAGALVGGVTVTKKDAAMALADQANATLQAARQACPKNFSSRMGLGTATQQVMTTYCMQSAGFMVQGHILQLSADGLALTHYVVEAPARLNPEVERTVEAMRAALAN